MHRTPWELGFSVARRLGLGGSICALVACSSSAATNDETQSAPSPGAAIAHDLDTPETLQAHGRTFLRRDRWSAADLARIEYEGRAEQPSTTPEVYAAQLRGQMLHNGAWYVEQTPNLELAKRILSGAPVPDIPSQLPEPEAETVIGTDTRFHAGGHTSFPQSAIAFNNSRGSGVRISQHALYTAAHVVFDTYGDSSAAPAVKPDGWYCANETTTANNNCTPWPSWIFGLEGTSGVSSWLPIGCWEATIPTAYVNITDPGNPDIWNQARFDYAAVSLSDTCNLGNTGWFGTSAGLFLNNYHSEGYAEYAPCQNNQDGDNLAHCTGGSWQLSGGPNTAPYVGAKIWAQNDISSVLPGGSGLGTFTLQTNGDITHGNSGGPLYNQLVPIPFMTVYALGVCSRAQESRTGNQAEEFNVYTRWSSETSNWFATFASYPN